LIVTHLSIPLFRPAARLRFPRVPLTVRLPEADQVLAAEEEVLVEVGEPAAAESVPVRAQLGFAPAGLPLPAAAAVPGLVQERAAAQPQEREAAPEAVAVAVHPMAMVRPVIAACAPHQTELRRLASRYVMQPANWCSSQMIFSPAATVISGVILVGS